METPEFAGVRTLTDTQATMPVGWRPFEVEWVAGPDPGVAGVFEWRAPGARPVMLAGWIRTSSLGGRFLDCGGVGNVLIDVADQRLTVLGRIVALKVPV